MSARKGEKHHMAKLTWKQVRHMRQLYAAEDHCTYQVLAIKYGVSITTIHNVISYVTWIDNVGQE